MNDAFAFAKVLQISLLIKTDGNILIMTTIVGFPRNARKKIEQPSPQHLFKWAKAYCRVHGRKTSPVIDFAFTRAFRTVFRRVLLTSTFER